MKLKLMKEIPLSSIVMTLVVCAGTAMPQAAPSPGRGRGAGPGAGGGGSNLLKIERDLEYARGLKLDLYSLNRPATKPLVVWFHDGDKFPTPITYLVADGYAVASVGYRSGQIADARAALDWLRNNAEKYSLDASHIGVAGDDKGGQIAAMLGVEGGVQAVVDVFGAVEKVEPPSNTAPLPAFLVLHGTADTAVSPRQSEKFVHALKAAGADATLEYVTGAGHEIRQMVTPATSETIAAFFDRTLRAGKRERADTDSITLPPDCWEDPIAVDTLSTLYKTYPTPVRGANTRASYRLYLPPDYNENKTRRYPAIYYLHGLNDSSRKAEAANYVQRLDAAIRGKIMPPAIVIVVQALNHSEYVDSKDGKIPVETAIVKDLISHVDSTYRTIARREGRAIEGHSMGGAGALHLAFKYPELFGTVASLSAALVDVSATSANDAERLGGMFGGDVEYFKSQTPAALLEKNADKLRGRMTIRLIVGDKDSLAVPNHAMDEMLTRLNIQHEFYLSKGAPHAVKEVLARLDFNPFEFYAKAFAPLHL